MFFSVFPYFFVLLLTLNCVHVGCRLVFPDSKVKHESECNTFIIFVVLNRVWI